MVQRLAMSDSSGLGIYRVQLWAWRVEGVGEVSYPDMPAVGSETEQFLGFGV